MGGELTTDLANFDHRNAVRIDLLDDFGFRARTRRCAEVRLALRVQELRRAADVFVVHREQTALVAIRVAHVDRRVQTEVVHAVVVVTCAAGIVGLAAIAGIGGHQGVERVAGGVDHGGGVTGSHLHAVSDRLGDRLEIEHQCRAGAARRVRLRLFAAQGQRAETGHRHRADTALDDLATAQTSGDEFIEVGGRARVVVLVVGVGELDGGVGVHVHVVSWGKGVGRSMDGRFNRSIGGGRQRSPARRGRRATSRRYWARGRVPAPRRSTR